MNITKNIWTQQINNPLSQFSWFVSLHSCTQLDKGLGREKRWRTAAKRYRTQQNTQNLFKSSLPLSHLFSRKLWRKGDFFAFKHEPRASTHKPTQTEIIKSTRNILVTSVDRHHLWCLSTSPMVSFDTHYKSLIFGVTFRVEVVWIFTPNRTGRGGIYLTTLNSPIKFWTQNKQKIQKVSPIR